MMKRNVRVKKERVKGRENGKKEAKEREPAVGWVLLIRLRTN